MADVFSTCLTRGWEPPCNSCCHHTRDQPIHALDVGQLISAGERQRFAFALADLHGIQRPHAASVPREQPTEFGHLRTDDCQVVSECPMHQPRS